MKQNELLKRNKKRILGIDLASYDTGWSVMTNELNYGLIHFPKSRPVEQRLLLLYNGLQEIIDTYQPEVMVLEDQFLGRNVKTLKTLSWVRGVVMLLAAQNEIPIVVITPTEIKQITTGKGNAGKEDIRKTVSLIFGIKEHLNDNVSDAIAIALSYILKGDQP